MEAAILIMVLAISLVAVGGIYYLYRRTRSFPTPIQDGFGPDPLPPPVDRSGDVALPSHPEHGDETFSLRSVDSAGNSSVQEIPVLHPYRPE